MQTSDEVDFFRSLFFGLTTLLRVGVQGQGQEQEQAEEQEQEDEQEQEQEQGQGQGQEGQEGQGQGQGDGDEGGEESVKKNEELEAAYISRPLSPSLGSNASVASTAVCCSPDACAGTTRCDGGLSTAFYETTSKETQRKETASETAASEKLIVRPVPDVDSVIDLTMYTADSTDRGAAHLPDMIQGETFSMVRGVRWEKNSISHGRRR